uniref:FHA domain-containing protein n=1 Tax=Schlesneria paludicola TaxID=360056 RepID=A0A7C4LM54_9PLAN
MSTPRDSSQQPSTTLLLCRGDGAASEAVYVYRGLSIGRAEGNTFRIDDEQVGRQHAIVEYDPDDRLMLRCRSDRDWIECDGQQVRELPLAAGVRFRIGPATFEHRCRCRRRQGGWQRVPRAAAENSPSRVMRRKPAPTAARRSWSVPCGMGKWFVCRSRWTRWNWCGKSGKGGWESSSRGATVPRGSPWR